MLVHVTDNNVRVSGRERKKKRKDIYIFPCSIKTVNDLKNLICGAVAEKLICWNLGQDVRNLV